MSSFEALFSRKKLDENHVYRIDFKVHASRQANHSQFTDFNFAFSPSMKIKSTSPTWWSMGIWHPSYTITSPLYRFETVQQKKPRKWDVTEDSLINNVSKSPVCAADRCCCFPKKCLIQFYRALYKDAMLVYQHAEIPQAFWHYYRVREKIKLCRILETNFSGKNVNCAGLYNFCEKQKRLLFN